MRLDEWACELDEARKEIQVYFKNEKKGSYKLIIALPSYCNKCMHPFEHESSCDLHWPDERIDTTFAIDIYCPKRAKNANLMTKHILDLKKVKEFAKPLSCAMIECSTKSVFPDLKLGGINHVVSVPDHPDEYKVDANTGEKYNQAEVIARYVAENLKIKMIDALCKKKPIGLSRLGKEKRRQLTHENYAIKQEVGDKLEGKNILLIDDTRVSGSTGDACANALKSIGANKVYLYVAGRSVISEVVEKCLRT